MSRESAQHAAGRGFSFLREVYVALTEEVGVLICPLVFLLSWSYLIQIHLRNHHHSLNEEGRSQGKVRVWSRKDNERVAKRASIKLDLGDVGGAVRVLASDCSYTLRLAQLILMAYNHNTIKKWSKCLFQRACQRH